MISFLNNITLAFPAPEVCEKTDEGALGKETRCMLHLVPTIIANRTGNTACMQQGACLQRLPQRPLEISLLQRKAYYCIIWP